MPFAVRRLIAQNSFSRAVVGNDVFADNDRSATNLNLLFAVNKNDAALSCHRITCRYDKIVQAAFSTKPLRIFFGGNLIELCV